MFNVTQLQTALDTAIGLRNTDDPDLPDCRVTTTDTGRYYNEYHPLITWENLYYIAPNYDGDSFSAWTATAYSTGDIILHDSIAYEATRTITATSTTPLTLTAWRSPVNSWVEQKVNASISKLANTVQTNKKMAKATKTFLQTTQLIDGPGRYGDTITPGSRFVGFEIIPKYTNNIKAVIDYIGLQFTEAQTDLKIYLFHSSQYSPIGIYTFTTSASNSFDWQNVTTNLTSGISYMPYVDYANNIDSGGSFYLGYFEDDISGSAIEKDFTTCYRSTKYNLITKWVDIRPMTVTPNGTNLFDIDDVGYTDSNFGLNISISVQADVTEMIVSNKALLTDALGYQFAIDMLDEMLHNPNSRINRAQENATRNKVLYELTEDQNANSLHAKMMNSISALNFDLSNISQVLPKKKPGMRNTWL